MSQPRTIAIFGATSAIAQAWARLHAARGVILLLIGRDGEKLAAVQQDLLARGADKVVVLKADLSQSQDYTALVDELYRQTERLDVALFAQGSLPDQRELENSVQDVRAVFELNALSYMLPAQLIANRMAQAGRGSIVLITSVAGDRGRQSNYFYGTCKAAASTFAQGLRNAMSRKGVHVMTVKPGFVDTPMTAHLPKGGPLWATPEQIAASIDNGLQRKRNVVYAPWFWRYIMLVVQHIPEMIFKRLSM